MAYPPVYRPFGAFRFLLALMVLLQHGLLLLPPGAGRETFYGLELGAVAVAVFFALSGFIVAEAWTSFYAGRPAAFLANRALRLVPPYFAALTLSVLADTLLFRTGHLVSLDSPLHGAPWQGRVLLSGLLEIVPGLPAHRISGQAFSFIPFAWTLRVEFAFYLLAAAAGWLLSRAPSWRGWLVALCFGALYGGFALFLFRQGQGGRQLLNAPFFAFGVCVFLWRRSRAVWVRLNLLLISACVPVAFVLCGERGHPVLALQLPLVAVLFAALLLLSGAPSPAPVFQNWDKRLGELSYPINIAHGVVLTVLAGLAQARGWSLYAAGITASIVLAAGLHTTVQKPLRAIRTRLRGATV